jgi:hypothetical protein
MSYDFQVDKLEPNGKKPVLSTPKNPHNNIADVTNKIGTNINFLKNLKLKYATAIGNTIHIANMDSFVR